MKLRVEIQDVDLVPVATFEHELDDKTSRLLGDNVNSTACGQIFVTIVHEEHLAALSMPPGIRPR